MYHWETADNKKYWTTDLSKKLINYFSKECITKPLELYHQTKAPTNIFQYMSAPISKNNCITFQETVSLGHSF